MLHRPISPGFLTHVLTVLKGNFVAIVIGFAALPVLSRLFPPESFGIYQSALSILTLLLIVASLRYEIPLLMARGLMELKSLLTLNVMINLAMTLLVTCGSVGALVLFPDQTRHFRFLLVIAPFWILAASLMQTFSYVVLHQHAFGVTARAKIAQASSNAGAGLGLGWAWPTADGLLLADFIGRLAAVWQMLKQCRHLVLPLGARRTRKAASLAARRYRNFPRISLPSAIISAGGGTLVPILMLLSFDAGTIGQFALVDRSVGAVIAVVAQSVGQVFMSAFAKSLRHGGGDPLHLLKRTMALQFAVGIIPTLVIILALPPLFTLVFGPQWRLAGEFGVILAPFYLMGFVATAVGFALVILENQKLQFLLDLFRTTGTIGVWVMAGHLHATPIEAMIAYSAFGSLAYLVYIIMAFATTRRHVRKLQPVAAP